MPVKSTCPQKSACPPASGRIFSIQRCSVHDGPGLRTVVYMKGCNMRCRWCHNPEGLDPRPQILFHKSRCIGCGACASVCPAHHSLDGNVHRFDQEDCSRCGTCARICPSKALELSGRTYSVDELVHILMKDADYYRRSGGGVSFSGGECLLQLEFLEAVAAVLHEKGVHVLLESALNLPWASVARAAAFTDAFYVDVKHMNSALHRSQTGAANDVILNNIRRLCELHGNVTLRTPLIPGFNDYEENLRETARFSAAAGARGLQLLRYNALASSKYESIGMPYLAFGTEAQAEEDMGRLCRRLNAYIGKPDAVFWKP